MCDKVNSKMTGTAAPNPDGQGGCFSEYLRTAAKNIEMSCQENKSMYYGEIKKYDIANGEGVRVSLFVSGCTHHCPGCFNQDTWDFRYGQEYTEKTQQEILDALAPGYINGLSLLGGEPFEPANQKALAGLLREVKEKYPEKNVWCYSGYLFDKELQAESRARCEYTDEMLSMIDVLVDGRFVEALKDIRLAFLGSSNQRIIDVKKSLKNGKIILWEPKVKRGLI